MAPQNFARWREAGTRTGGPRWRSPRSGHRLERRRAVGQMPARPGGGRPNTTTTITSTRRSGMPPIGGPTYT
eukprot:scaffold868_cov305-Prasinococcus_capsulatus_cf.AAC.4